jgi:hypothetical protein
VAYATRGTSRSGRPQEKCSREASYEQHHTGKLAADSESGRLGGRRVSSGRLELNAHECFIPDLRPTRMNAVAGTISDLDDDFISTAPCRRRELCSTRTEAAAGDN